VPEQDISTGQHQRVTKREREILERAVREIRAKPADLLDLLGELEEAGFDGSHPLSIEFKSVRLELFELKSAMEEQLERLVLDFSECGPRVHRVSGLGATPGHWAHRDPAPHGEATLQGGGAGRELGEG
jgi:hypothetical protein